MAPRRQPGGNLFKPKSEPIKPKTAEPAAEPEINVVNNEIISADNDPDKIVEDKPKSKPQKPKEPKEPKKTEEKKPAQSKKDLFVKKTKVTKVIKSLNLDSDVVEEVKKIADANSISESNVVNLILHDYFEI